MLRNSILHHAMVSAALMALTAVDVQPAYMPLRSGDHSRKSRGRCAPSKPTKESGRCGKRKARHQFMWRP